MHPVISPEKKLFQKIIYINNFDFSRSFHGTSFA